MNPKESGGSFPVSFYVLMFGHHSFNYTLVGGHEKVWLAK